MMDIEKIATRIAIEMKASGMADAADHYDEELHGHLTDAQWGRVVVLAAEKLPAVEVPQDIQAAWVQANRDYWLCQGAEARAFARDF